MTGDVKIAASRREQSKADKEALFERLRNKKRKSLDLKVELDDGPMTFTFEAISSTELDKLRAKHPPTKSQVADGMGVNTTTFNPALVAATLVEPFTLTDDEAVEIFGSDRWSQGELAMLVEAASTVCLRGFDIPSNASA